MSHEAYINAAYKKAHQVGAWGAVVLENDLVQHRLKGISVASSYSGVILQAAHDVAQLLQGNVDHLTIHTTSGYLCDRWEDLASRDSPRLKKDADLWRYLLAQQQWIELHHQHGGNRGHFQEAYELAAQHMDESLGLQVGYRKWEGSGSLWNPSA